MTDQTSELLYMRAKLRLPGGVNSPVRAYQAVGRTPRFIQSAKGSHTVSYTHLTLPTNREV